MWEQLGAEVWRSVAEGVPARLGVEVLGTYDAAGATQRKGPLAAIVVCGNDTEWTLVSVGLSAPNGVRAFAPDLREFVAGVNRKLASGPRLSEFELTLRAPRAGRAPEPPMWAIEGMIRVAAALRASRFPPILPTLCDAPRSVEVPLSRFGAWLLVRDVALPEIRTPAEPVTLVQMVGLYDDEAEACRDWTRPGFADVFLRAFPRGPTDPERPTVMSGPSGDEIRRGSSREGSDYAGFSPGALLVAGGERDGEPVTIVLPPDAAPWLRRMLLHRLARGLDWTLLAGERRVEFRPGAAPSVRREGETVRIEVPAELAADLGDVFQPRLGLVRIAPLCGLRISSRSSSASPRPTAPRRSVPWAAPPGRPPASSPAEGRSASRPGGSGRPRLLRRRARRGATMPT